MTNTLRAVIREGRIDTREPVGFPDGAQVLVTLRSDDDAEFWQKASRPSLDEVWESAEDDVYAALLEE